MSNDNLRKQAEHLLKEFKQDAHLNDSLHALQDLVEQIAEKKGFDSEKAFNCIIRDILMLEFFQIRVSEARACLAEGDLPEFVYTDNQ